MCGIAGYMNADPAQRADAGLLKRMTDTIVHRGPDDEGFFVSGPVALGVRRLAIIDLVTGGQPIGNEDGTVHVVFNGEIYNYRELREELLAKGHRFTTQSDTEVLVHLYEEEGDAFVGRLNAMAALALWDGPRRRLLLARDRMGKKPLHYALGPGGLVFGSELKVLLEHPAVTRSVDFPAMARYLLHEYVPTPHSIFTGVAKLRPGHIGIYEGGRFTERPYWDLPAVASDAPKTQDEARERIRATLLDSVRRRLMSDVPLGVFLSGGLDSSSVVACMARAAPGKVRTFSIAFEESSFDESSHFRRVASHFGAIHTERTLTAATLLDLLGPLADILDEPFADPSILPTYLLSRFTREHVTVALGGEGGDELLAGYPTYQAHRLAAWYERLPRAVRAGAIEPLVRRLPVSRRNISLDFKARRFIAGAGLPPEIRNQVWLGSRTAEEARALLRRDLREMIEPIDLYDECRRHYAAAPASDTLGKLLYVDLKMYLHDGILAKVDRAGMACSLEVRAPLLDYRFVELVASMPSSWKLRGMTTKHIFKQAMEPWLPPGIARRPKKGFGIPVADWLRGALRPLMLDLLSDARLRAQGFLEPAAVQRLVSEHLSGRADHRKPLWTLLMLQLWSERWVRRT